jgi:hypothetical protein
VFVFEAPLPKNTNAAMAKTAITTPPITRPIFEPEAGAAGVTATFTAPCAAGRLNDGGGGGGGGGGGLNVTVTEPNGCWVVVLTGGATGEGNTGGAIVSCTTGSFEGGTCTIGMSTETDGVSEAVVVIAEPHFRQNFAWVLVSYPQEAH